MHVRNEEYGVFAAVADAYFTDTPVAVCGTAGPGVVLMSGRVMIRVRTGEQKTANDLNYLAVWREENGHWRFLAWQSCKNPPAVPASAAK